MFRTSISAAAMITLAFFAGTATSQTTKAKAEPPKVESKYSLRAKVSDIKIGDYISGPKITADDLKGRVVLLDYWGSHSAPSMASIPGVVALNTELADFGLLVLGSHMESDAEADKVRLAAATKGMNYTISIETRIMPIESDFNGVPHCYVFDHTGKTLFRGEPKEAEAHIRSAVGNALVASLGREKFSTPMQPIVTEMKAGRPPATMIAKTILVLKTAKGETAVEAQLLLDAMTASGKKKLKEADGLQEKDPLAAFLLVEKIPVTFRNTTVATQATELLVKLKKEKPVEEELAARTALAAVKKLELPLVKTADMAHTADFQKKNAAQLKLLKAKILEMKKTWPDAPSTKESLVIAERYKIEVE